MDKTIYFSKWYDKLDEKLFCTVRSIKYMNTHNINVGDEVDIIYKRNNYKFKAILIGYYNMVINDMPMEFIHYDTNSYNVRRLHNKHSFVNLLNSFVPKYSPNSLLTKKQILFLLRKEEI